MNALVNGACAVLVLHSAMGRLTKTTATSTKPTMKVHYSKLVDEYNSQMDDFDLVPDYLSYCCHQCGHEQKLKVNTL